MILITHDRSLMGLVADRLWAGADGSVRPFDGDMAPTPATCSRGQGSGPGAAIRGTAARAVAAGAGAGPAEAQAGGAEARWRATKRLEAIDAELTEHDL